MYSEYLEYSGYEVIQASDGMAAIQRATNDHPDVIVMDLSLPVMDGREAIRRLKADSRTASILVVALTGYDAAGGGTALDVECDAFLTKPCLPEDLAEQIRRLLERKSSQG
jgi:CheY-like chemotaxis protein